MWAGTLRSQVSIIHGRICPLLVPGPKNTLNSRLTKRDRGGSAHVLVNMLVYHSLKHVGLHILFVHNYGVVGGTSSPLNRRVRIKIEVITERLRYVSIHQSTWNRIAVLVRSKTALREDANMVTLLGNNDSEVDLCHVNLHMDKIAGLLEITL